MIFDSSRNNFLFIHYRNMDFIVARSQFSSSISFKAIDIIDNNKEYFSDIVKFGNDRILNLNLDKYLIDNYKAEVDNPIKLSIISRTDQFTKKTSNLFALKLKNNKKHLSTKLVALSLTSKSEIKKESRDEFRIFSGFLNQSLKKEGLNGCVFSNERIQYFIDIDKIIYNTLQATGDLGEHNHRA